MSTEWIARQLISYPVALSAPNARVTPRKSTTSDAASTKAPPKSRSQGRAAPAPGRRLPCPISITARQDFTSAVGGVDKFVHTRLAARTAFKMKIRPVNSAVSATNPSYILSKGRFHSESPLDGSHGSLLENKIEFRAQSGCTITRSTST